MEGTQLLARIADDIRDGANPSNATGDALRESERTDMQLLNDVRHMPQLDGRVGRVAAQNAMESVGGEATTNDVISMLTYETYRWLAKDLADE